MIVVMKHGSTQEQIDHVVELIEELGLRSHIIQGTDRTVVAALGEKRDGAKQALETGDGVEKVMPILTPRPSKFTRRAHVSLMGMFAHCTTLADVGPACPASFSTWTWMRSSRRSSNGIILSIAASH